MNFDQILTAPEALCGDAASLAGTDTLNVDTAQSLCEEVMAVLRGAEEHPGTALSRATLDVWQHIRPGMPPQQRDRFRTHVQIYLDGCVKEVTARRTEEPPDLETYLQLHRSTVRLGFIYVLAEYCLGIDLTHHVAEHLKEFEAIHTLATDQVVLFNDLLSLRKEVGDGEILNSIIVLAHHEGLSLQEAVDQVFARAVTTDKQFVALRSELLAGSLGQATNIRSYLQEPGHIMFGSREYEYYAPRYAGNKDWSMQPRPGRHITLAPIPRHPLTPVRNTDHRRELIHRTGTPPMFFWQEHFTWRHNPPCQ
ncbi:terpene synthase family protein [Streptomyces olivoreticuli]|uniref:terpene synthase family protein n=1 Tax=Streptomyces olivoreticuli TaxID=68246 RepID=UPI002659836F|nr:terpene synthase family protein [Streptomyces olivoreticuli]WKK24075.1 terpene synthase family protein [Streptomyces olivoreticuli]